MNPVPAMRAAPKNDRAETRPVLIVDDDPDAVEVAQAALRRARIPNPVTSLTDGPAAIEYFRRCLRGERELPLFVFLDLNLPGLDGFHVLDWLRHQPGLRHLITVVLSVSREQADVDRAFALGADAYLPKFPPVSEIETIFQLANAMLSVDELEQQLWPGLRPPAAGISPRRSLPR